MEYNTQKSNDNLAGQLTKAQKQAERKKEKMRRDKEYNLSIISAAYSELLVEKKKIPSYPDIAKRCNLSVSTVERHLKDFNFEDYMVKFRTGSEVVMLNLFRQAATGNSEKMIRLYLESVKLLKRKLDITSNGKQINTPPKEGTMVVDVTKLSEAALVEVLQAAGETV